MVKCFNFYLTMIDLSHVFQQKNAFIIIRHNGIGRDTAFGGCIGILCPDACKEQHRDSSGHDGFDALEGTDNLLLYSDNPYEYCFHVLLEKASETERYNQ